MAQPIVYIDRSVIRPGKLAELRKAIADLVRFVDGHESQLLSYIFHIDPESSALTLVAVHPDSASLELHLGIAGPEFRKVGEFIDLQVIEVFGVPTVTAVAQLRQKASMLGTNARVVVHEPEAGFSRVQQAARPGAVTE